MTHTFTLNDLPAFGLDIFKAFPFGIFGMLTFVLPTEYVLPDLIEDRDGL